MRTRTFKGTRKKLINGGKRPLLGYLVTVNTYKFQITATILITNILLIWWVRVRNLMAHGDAREGKWRGKMRMEWVASSFALDDGARSIRLLSADPHSSSASSRLNWHPRRFKWTRPFRWKTKSGFCACAITFRTCFTINGNRLSTGKRVKKVWEPLLQAISPNLFRKFFEIHNFYGEKSRSYLKVQT